MEQVLTFKYVLSAIVYAMVGLLVLLFSFIIFDRLTPGNLWKEVILEKNLPLAITVSGMMIAIGQIIASAIHS